MEIFFLEPKSKTGISEKRKSDRTFVRNPLGVVLKFRQKMFTNFFGKQSENRFDAKFTWEPRRSVIGSHMKQDENVTHFQLFKSSCHQLTHHQTN